MTIEEQEKYEKKQREVDAGEKYLMEKVGLLKEAVRKLSHTERTFTNSGMLDGFSSVSYLEALSVLASIQDIIQGKMLLALSEGTALDLDIPEYKEYVKAVKNGK